MATRLGSLVQLLKLDISYIRSRQIAPKSVFDRYRGMATGFHDCGSAAREDEPTQLERGPGLLKVLENSPKRLERIEFLSKLFETNGFELRIAGGAVRDMLMGKEPKDIDFATTAPPERTLDIVNHPQYQDLLRVIVTAAGQKHGTVAVKFKEGPIDFKRIKLSPEITVGGQEQKQQSEPEYDEESPYEITTLRCDKLTDGRHADVEFIRDWHVDAERRDLTINAMFLTLKDGKLIDYFGGESDLKEGIVRFVGDADRRIKEDYLRILRYFRFWSRYSKGKQPDDETLKKLTDNLAGLNQISGERIWQEIRKTLSHLPCYDAFELMLRIRLFDYAGLLDENLKDYDEYVTKVLQEVKSAQDNIHKYLRDTLNPKLEADPQDLPSKRLKELVPVIIFAAAIQTDALCHNAYNRLKFSNIERDTILYIIENRDKEPGLSAFKFQLVMSPVPERPSALLRMRAFLISRGLFSLIDELEAWKVPQFPISGKTVSKAVKERGLPNDKTREVLESIKLDWAKNNYRTDEATLERSIATKLDAIKQT